ncbi:type ISP restriction/modification enzyme [Leptospira dzoumogneensis]|uniref:site-specific DNA-methyltransferase (adenine-specific) n=1 Tax=Leptospira dzoumogneensis TaxID=2484904 RepID=A0A4Z1ALX4_9LEPT|nr:type ISP restriction/modification enzyme [Leptospira dzoumogneensis]TGN02699.1 DNA methyltransferase [Leptospira dzoumogneensis]
MPTSPRNKPFDKITIQALDRYIHSLETIAKTESFSEQSFRGPLADFVHSIESNILANNEPMRVACGAPDFVVYKNNVPIGYIETKKIGANLNSLENSDQLKRYRSDLSNLILTDYLEFRWFVDGEFRLSSSIGKFKNNRIIPFPNMKDQVLGLLDCFINEETPVSKDPKELAIRMGKLGRMIRDTIKETIKEAEKSKSPSVLKDQMKAFHSRLIKGLSEEQFADMYAQTICYGLFAARCNHHISGSFNREKAVFELPNTNPFLKRMFNSIAGTELDKSVTWIVDDLAYLLDRADFDSILKDFGKKTKQEDPVVHFYETFLSSYDPNIREKRGVYYTPEPIVKYIIYSVDSLLKEKKGFNIPNGLADSKIIPHPKKPGEKVHRISILDPSVGTGTFLFELIKTVFKHFEKNKGSWQDYVQSHLLPRMFGFEFLMAPYSIAHLKIVLQLRELGYQFDSEERLKIYLTNSLEDAPSLKETDGLDKFLEQEAQDAWEIKNSEPVSIIVGNPPYSGHSENSGDWITDLLHSKEGNYFEFDGKPLKEQNLKWLNDDYVKFLRFAQWKIENTGHGILAFVTNHGYLDNPTFRGMRQSLRKTFDEIYVLDLHGNSKKKEKQSDGSQDENVFEIQQGVAIGIFVKRITDGNTIKKPGRVFHSEIFGDREGKYDWLSKHNIKNTEWEEINPSKEFCLFKPQNERRREEYESNNKITEIMYTFSLGILTKRDSLTVAFTEEELQGKISHFTDSSLSDEEVSEEFSIPIIDKDRWDLKKARQEVKKFGSKQFIKDYTYRPFDSRSIYFYENIIARPNTKVMDHFDDPENLALVIGRQGLAVGGDTWNLVFVVNKLVDQNIFRRGGGTVFPLYTIEEDLFSGKNKRSNFSDPIIEELRIKQGTEDPEALFYYIYAILYSPKFRKRYSEFLKIDFPRIPLTSNRDLFKKLVQIGKKLTKCHLFQSNVHARLKFPMEGDSIIKSIFYDGEKTVWINETQYFGPISQKVWNYNIGGFQICEKWLKDRKGRQLTFLDIQHYSVIVHSIEQTIQFEIEIDEHITKSGGFPFK